jgi:hypothetical protein
MEFLSLSVLTGYDFRKGRRCSSHEYVISLTYRPYAAA